MGEHLQIEMATTAIAPDGSHVDVLLRVDNVSTARFVFPARSVSVPVRHRTVTEIWHVLAGRGRFWSDNLAGDSEGRPGIDIAPGSSISILPGEAFQITVTGGEPLSIFGVTTPSWPGDGEAQIVDGPWQATLDPGPH